MNAPEFDGASYWRARMQRTPSLVGTGWIGIALPWQRSLYAAKRRAFQRVFAQSGIALAGRTVLDFGCGTGYFEHVWERAGASRTAGIDIAPNLIEDLSRRFPHRQYACLDLTVEDVPFAPHDLVTAIDVMYHVVDDGAARQVVSRLLDRVAEGGSFLGTDGWPAQNRAVATHVRHRSRDWWEDVAGSRGFQR